MALAIPELALRDIIEAAIAALQDGDLIDELLSSRPPAERDSYRTALAVREGKVILGWSMEPPTDYQITVAMGGQDQTPFVGDAPMAKTEKALALRLLTDDITAAKGITLPLASIPDVPEDVDARGLVRIDQEYAIYRIDSGAVILDERGILKTDAVAHAEDAEVVFFEWQEARGWHEHLAFRVDVAASNGVFVIVLARLVKACLVQAVDAFEAAGMTLTECRESDVQLRVPNLPANYFQRTLMVRARCEFHVPYAMPVLTRTDVTVAAENVEVAVGGTQPSI